MNMVKEGIQTRRRKQKATGNNPIVKVKHSKSSLKSSTSSESHPHHSILTKTDDYLPRQVMSSYGKIYPSSSSSTSSHVHVLHHPFGTHQPFPSHPQMDLPTTNTNFNPDLHARELLPTSLSKPDEQHLNLIEALHSNQS